MDEVKLSIGGEDVGMKNSIKEEVKKDEGRASMESSEENMDSLKEERIWRFRMERMKNALAATRIAGGQGPEETYRNAQILVDVIEDNEVEGFISMIEWLANQTDLFAILNFPWLPRGSLLHVAAAAGKDNILRLLLDHVSDHLIAAKNDRGDTPLHIAAAGKDNILRLLLDHVSKHLIAAENDRGDTPLHIAAAGKDNILRLLLDHARYPQIYTQNEWGDTPLHIAAKTAKSEAVKMLIQRARYLSNVKGKNSILRMSNKQGNTPLHEAMLNCHANTAQLLLEEDLESVYLKNKAEKSPLYLALDSSDSKMLDPVPLHSLDPLKIEGLPPVHGAIVCKNYGILTQIHTTNMKLFAMTDSGGGNLFHFAAYTNRGEVFNQLNPKTEYLAKKQDNNGDLPIHIASKKGYVGLIQRLHSVSELLNKKGQTVLHVAAKYGQNSVVRYILRDPELRKLINERDHAGNTPLHLAAMHSQPAALVTLVLAEKIGPSLLNQECLTPWNIAVDRFTRVYASREALALLVLEPTSDSTTELLVRRPEIRDKVSFIVYSRKEIPKFDLLKDKIDSLLVVATLVATVTFAAGFAIPGGFNSSDTASKYDRGMATMLDKRLFQAFVICNTIAMFSSMITIINLLYAQERDFYVAATALNYTLFSLKIALSAMSAAFLTGVTLIVGKIPWLANIIFYMGLLFLLIISSATWWECLLPIQSYGLGRPIHRLKCWLILGFIYLLGVPTYILDDQEEDGRASTTSTSQPPDGAGESKAGNSVIAK